MNGFLLNVHTSFDIDDEFPFSISIEAKSLFRIFISDDCAFALVRQMMCLIALAKHCTQHTSLMVEKNLALWICCLYSQNSLDHSVFHILSFSNCVCVSCSLSLSLSFSVCVCVYDVHIQFIRSIVGRCSCVGVHFQHNIFDAVDTRALSFSRWWFFSFNSYCCLQYIHTSSYMCSVGFFECSASHLSRYLRW